MWSGMRLKEVRCIRLDDNAVMWYALDDSIVWKLVKVAAEVALGKCGQPFLDAQPVTCEAMQLNTQIIRGLFFFSYCRSVKPKTCRHLVTQ